MNLGRDIGPSLGVGWFGHALLVFGFGVLGGSLGVIASRIHPLDPELPGRVASGRAKAVESLRLLWVLDALVRWLSGAVWSLPGMSSRLKGYLVWQRAQLNLAGYPWNLSEKELPVVAILLGLLGMGLGAALGLKVNLVLALFVAGPVATLAHVSGRAGDRKRLAGRSMPRVMDMLSLCMSSGMDLVAALHHVSTGDRGVLADELGYLLRTLEMGQTRGDALRALALSLPAPEVGDFCRAIIQAEAKGASMREALAQQAAMSRTKRSVRAEEAAARAGVLLLAPMLMLVVCILLLIVGPLLIGGTGF